MVRCFCDSCGASRPETTADGNIACAACGSDRILVAGNSRSLADEKKARSVAAPAEHTKPDTLTVDGTEYTVEWDGEHVVLCSEESAGGQSNPELIVGEADGIMHVELGDGATAWAFETLGEAEEFRAVMQAVMNRHLAAAREAGRREALGRCSSVDNLGQRCCREAGHAGWHETEKKPPPTGPLPGSGRT